MTRHIAPNPISASEFKPFGDLIDAAGDPDKIINQGLCGRFHDRARLDFGGGRAGISLFRSELCELPLTLRLMERHPEGSQAFIPMCDNPFLVVVARDENGEPGRPSAFITKPLQAVNLLRGTWHGVLTPLAGSGHFAVVDRIGDGLNLQEHSFKTPWIVG